MATSGLWLVSAVNLQSLSIQLPTKDCCQPTILEVFFKCKRIAAIIQLEEPVYPTGQQEP